MGVSVREKKKGSGEWWLFITHSGERKSKKIGRDKRKATRLAKEIEVRLAAGDLGILKKSAKPFSDYCQQWLTVIMPTECKASTQDDQRAIVNNHLRSAPFYSTSVDSVTENDIETYLIGKRNDLARSTVVHIKNAISNSFKRALKARVIKINPCTNVSIPKTVDGEKTFKANPYNRQEIDQLLEAFSGSRHYVMILFMVRTGCRAGEVSGLQWRDLDFASRKAHIRRGIVRGRVADTTKSKKDRKVDLSPILVKELRELKIKSISTGEWVFQSKAGGFIDMPNFRKRIFNPTIKKVGLRQVRLHDLRHSYASLLIKLTKDIYYAQQQLGHASITTTVGTYGHLLEEDGEERGVDKLDAPNSTLSATTQKKESNKTANSL